MSYTSLSPPPWKFERVRPGVLFKFANPQYEGTKPNEICLAIEEDVYKHLGAHSGIMQCHGLKKKGKDKGLEFYDRMRETLQSALASSDYGLIPLETRKRWCQQIVETLVFCHSKGVLHEDLHPENAMLVSERSGTTGLQLVNFGAGKCRRLGLLDSRVNASGFFNPKHELEMGPAADIFAVGSLIYTIMTGRWPGAPGTISTFHECMLYSSMIDSLLLKGDLPPVEEDVYAAYVILNCWRGNYETSAEVLEDLKKEL